MTATSQKSNNTGTMFRLLSLMAERSASDLYFTANSPIYIKIEGEMYPATQKNLDDQTIHVLLREVLKPKQIEKYRRTFELNTAFSIPKLGNFRISVMRQRNSTAFVVRFIPPKIPPFDTLGLPQVLKKMVMGKMGLILMVGTTGSGKTTTLTSMLDHRNSEVGGHILTIEDPIEYMFTNKKSIINQREVGSDTLTSKIGLKNALRQAPDCILIGEIRDQETMAQAITYAQSGHLCLATLHANNSHHALSRIITMFPAENRSALLADLASSVRCIIGQRLVKKMDGNRLPVVEVLVNSKHISDLIEKGNLLGIQEAIEKSMSDGSQSFEQALYQLYKSGAISLDQALEHADSPNNLQWLIDNSSESRSRPNEPEF